MGLAAERETRLFRLLVRCTNCLRDSEVPLTIPVGEGAPCDREALVESAVLNELKFQCSRCESVIGQIVGISGGELI